MKKEKISRVVMILCITFTSFVIFGLTESSLAADFYVAQTARGGDTGTDCANAHSAAWFNTSGNWANPKQSGKIGPGDTAHLCGTFTGSANANILTVLNSGSNGSPITIKWESSALLTSPACSESGCIDLQGNSYLVLDGNGTNPSLTNTNNGSPQSGYTYQLANNGIKGVNVNNNVEFKNLTITNLYVHTSLSDKSGGGQAIFLANGGSNVSIHDCYFDNVGGAYVMNYGNNSNISIYNNTLDHFSHGIHIGANGATVINGVYIYNNHFKNMSNWDTTNFSFHDDGIIIYQASGQANSVKNIYIYGNLFDGDVGNCSTAWIFPTIGLNGIYIYNNVLLNTGRRLNANMIESATTGDQNIFIYNNYIDGGQATCMGIGATTGLSIINNALNNCYTYLATTGVSGTITIDYNAYNLADASTNHAFKWDNPSGATFAQYRTAHPTYDVHSITPTSLGTSISGAPANSTLIGMGTNLTSLSINALNLDKLGTARPSIGAWTIGPYQIIYPQLNPPQLRAQ